jgi:PAS domain S-box-containing protein
MEEVVGSIPTRSTISFAPKKWRFEDWLLDDFSAPAVTSRPVEPGSADRAARLLAAIVESSEDAIISKDLNGIITSWNSAAERILGWRSDEVVGQSIILIIPAELREEENRILARLRSGDRIEHFQTLRKTKSGELLEVSLTISPVRDANGKIVGAAKILRDVTQQRKLERALHTSERLASVGRLAATVAHEINNPLEAITNYIFLAKEQPGVSEKVKRYLTAADEELRRVALIAQQTLGFYRDNSQPSMLSLSTVLREVLTIYDRKLRYKSLKAQVEIEPGLEVCTVEGELKQILSNLIINAIDASHDGGRVLIRARSSCNFQSGMRGVRISVADYGSGIAAENKSRIFDPFFTTKVTVGTGLGLWITKELLERKGGAIRFRSSTSNRSGTVMSIFLPQELPASTNGMVA